MMGFRFVVARLHSACIVTTKDGRELDGMPFSVAETADSIVDLRTPAWSKGQSILGGRPSPLLVVKQESRNRSVAYSSKPMARSKLMANMGIYCAVSLLP